MQGCIYRAHCAPGKCYRVVLDLDLNAVVWALCRVSNEGCRAVLMMWGVAYVLMMLAVLSGISIGDVGHAEMALRLCCLSSYSLPIRGARLGCLNVGYRPSAPKETL